MMNKNENAFERFYSFFAILTAEKQIDHFCFFQLSRTFEKCF